MKTSGACGMFWLKGESWETALREGEERLRLAQVYAKVGVWDWYPQTGELRLTPELHRIYGLEPETVRTYQDWRRHVHPEDIDRVETERNQALDRREPVHTEFRLCLSSGEIRWVESKGGAIFDERGRVVRVLGVSIDITDRKRAEDALGDAERSMRQIVDAIPQLVWTCDAQGNCDYLSTQWAHFTGVPAERQLGHGWFESLHADDRERVMKGWKAAVAAGVRFDAELRIQGADRSFRWFSSSGIPLRDDHGRIVKWFGTCTDINDQKTVEEALRQEHQRKDEFLAVLGHELRNPLSPIRNAAHLLKLPRTGDEIVHRSAEVIERQVNHLSRLIDDLLDVARISRGKVQLRRERFDVAAVVRSFARDYAPAIETGGLRLEMSMPDHPIWVFGDPARVQQIVGNLLHNSSKFTDSGGKVHLSLGTEKNDALIVVQDTGIGIEPELLQHLFEPFMQAQSSLNRERGLGLGLALVRGIAELHGGSVQAQSDGIGRGARFSVRLPLDGEADRVEPPKVMRAAEIDSRRVLIVEDNYDSAEILQMLLEALGHEVTVAHSGLEGLHKARTFNPDVVLCDIGLPGEMDGYEVAKTIRADRELSSKFLIAMTGYGQDEDRRRAQDAGFDRHLTKPAEPDEVKRALASSRPSAIKSTRLATDRF